MLRFRIASMGALAAIAVALAGSAASAQTAATQPGKPVALLAGLNPPHEAKSRAKSHVAKSHASKSHAAKAAAHEKTAHARTHHHGRTTKIANKTTGKQSHAVATNEPMDPPAPTAAVAQNKWPAPPDSVAAKASAAPPATAVADNTLPAPQDNAPPAAATAPSSGDADLNALVVNGQTVRISASDDVNDIDRAASPQSRGAQNAEASAPAADSGNDLQPAMTRVATAAISDDAGQPAKQRANAGSVDGASWTAQILAALGGAVAACAVAWFLIGSGPLRTYG